MTDFKVIDNVFPENVLDKIDNFFKNGQIRIGATEAAPKKDRALLFSINPSLQELIGTFEADTYIGKHLEEFNSQASFKHLERFYINIIKNGDKFDGHSDILESKLVPDKFYIVALMFLNPYSNGDSGFYIKDNYIEDKYNRLILFDGTDWHKTVVPTDDLVRITLYCNFSNRKGRDRRYMDSDKDVRSFYGRDREYAK